MSPTGRRPAGHWAEGACKVCVTCNRWSREGALCHYDNCRSFHEPIFEIFLDGVFKSRTEQSNVTSDPPPSSGWLYGAAGNDQEMKGAKVSDYTQGKTFPQKQEPMGGQLGGIGQFNQAQQMIPTRNEEHIKHLLDVFGERMAKKYRRGVEEHGGYLPDMVAAKLLENAIDEAIDQVVYLLTLKDNLGV